MYHLAIFSFAVLLLASLAGCSQGLAGPRGQLVLAEGGRSEYRIVTAADASASTRHAAAELQRFLKEITAAALPIVSDAEPVGEHEIVLGDSTHLRKLKVAIDFEKLGHEGYVLKTAGGHLVIAGSSLRGNLYGVYGLLEDHLGCRWFTPEVSRIPRQDRLSLPALDETVIPPLEYRDPYVRDCFDADWSARNRMNGSSQLTAEHGGNVRFGAGLFCHTVFTLVPPEKYFKDHPEYFALVDGKRVNHTEICYTNEDVIRIATEAMRQHMRSDPEAMVFSLSHMDTWKGYCQCDRCMALADKEGSQAACVLVLVNKVAAAVESEFPGKAIETLAYTWNRKPPRTMRPRPNVIIRLCSIECCFSHPLDACDAPSNLSFMEDLKGWAKLCNRLWVWNYDTNFHHYMAPFPNYQVWAPNTRMFVENHVTGLFTEDNYQSPNGEFNSLGGYVRAKLLWNPRYDPDKAIDEFLDGVYGKGGKSIRQYMDLLTQKVVGEHIHVRIYDEPPWVYLTDEVLTQAEALWDQAEAAVAGQGDVLRRVRIARLSLDYAQLEQARARGAAAWGRPDHRTFTVVPDPALLKRVDRFRELGKAAGITTLMEGTLTVEHYCDSLPFLKPVTLTPQEQVALGSAAQGLAYQRFDGRFDTWPDFATLKPGAAGTAQNLDASLGGRPADFALVFSGCVSVPKDGIYTFSLTCDAGGRLYVGKQQVIGQGGPHAGEMTGAVALKAGAHPIRVEYLHRGGGTTLELRYEGPDLKKQKVPAAAYLRTGT